MAKSVNKVILVGNVGQDPEVKYTPSGVPVARVSLATNERFKDGNDQWQDRTEWHSIVAWQRLAGIVGEYVRKGTKLYIEGKLQTTSWEDKQSAERKYRTEIVARDIVLLGSRDSGQVGREEMSHEQSSPDRSVTSCRRHSLLRPKDLWKPLPLVEPQTGTGTRALNSPPSPRLSVRPGAFPSYPSSCLLYLLHSGVHTGKRVAMRVFRASDKMSAKEPVSPTRAQGWDPIFQYSAKRRYRAPVLSGAGSSLATLKCQNERQNVDPKTGDSSARPAATMGRTEADAERICSLRRNSASVTLGAPAIRRL